MSDKRESRREKTQRTSPGRFGIFLLTVDEQRLILFVVMALLVGSLVQHYRRLHPRPLPVVKHGRELVPPKRSTPTPNQTEGPE